MENSENEGKKKQNIGSIAYGYLKDSHWWLGVLGNMLATMLGIAMTVGVGYWTSYRNDKKIAKEMMFQVLRTCENNSQTIASYDSAFQVHSKAIQKLLKLRSDNNGDLSKVPDDTLTHCVNSFFTLSKTTYSRTYVDTYFFDAQMMHQFGNPMVYSSFVEFVKEDQDAFEKIDALEEQWENLVISINSAYTKYNSVSKALEENVENKQLETYVYKIIFAGLGSVVAQEKNWFDNLLKQSGATKQEYKQYIESTSEALEDNEDFHYSEKFGEE